MKSQDLQPQESSNRQFGVDRVASPGQMSGEPAEQCGYRSPLSCEACIAALHDLNNAFALVLMNAQVMEGKLPSYSRSKRYIHEIERGAQRGGALLKRLLAQLSGAGERGMLGWQGSFVTRVPPVGDCAAMVAVQEPRAAEEGVLSAPSPSAANAAPVFVAE